VDVDALRALIFELADEAEGEGAAWHFMFGGVQMACMTDASFGRMRIVAPLLEVSAIRSEHMYAMLDANYHSALDVRYAISDEMVMVAYIHPLDPLTADQVRSAVAQVASAVQSFGGEYSSGELVFGPGRRSGGGSPQN
jgi:hypothetical protein